MLRNKVILLAVLVLGATLASASTIGTLGLQVGSDWITLTTTGTCADSQAGAICAGFTKTSNTNQVTLNGSLGVWTVNVSTGLIVSTVPPEIDLNSVNLSSGAGTILIGWTVTGFTGSGGNAHSAIGGTTGGTVEYQAYYDNSDTAFGYANTIGALLTFNTTPFAGATNGMIAGDGSYSLTQLVQITHAGAGVTSYDAHLSIPEPASMTILGAGMIGLAGLFRRKLVK
ncbi:MAG TPA: PEP-CTERM sorting domain-containing protein [Terriglobales bacterium]|nr:PEP-CTERM sorting domain-containing protein [Terriglobales bacterium]